MKRSLCVQDLVKLKEISDIQISDDGTLLIFHGENDLRCPVEQAEELHANISKNGLGSSEFIRYSDSDHAFPGSGAPRYRLDFNNRCLEWLISKQNNN